MSKSKPQLGEMLRELRESQELPLRSVASAAEMDQAHLSKIELGQRLPTQAQAKALAKFFKIDPNELEALRIVEKFRSDYAGNPAAEQAINILREEMATYSAKKRTT